MPRRCRDRSLSWTGAAATWNSAAGLAARTPALHEAKMNVTCPQCSTVFRVDPAKVPEQGVRARCSVCGGLIAVRRPAMAQA
ncbi:MAG: zinc-ribbon domain-containing protein, partial [Gemmatimonadaceae bacterium]